ncbi:MAG TPA: GMC family oxidoreductase, partial [Gemmatimonadaceae bacterium]|nr:GMC family oxidoreductase [Gemmatimonadaceae bacterium]
HWEVASEEGSALWLVREQLRLLQAGRVRVPTPRELAQLARGGREILSLGWQRAVRGRRAFPAGAAIHLRVDSEQRPDPESRITLGEGADAYGLPRLLLDWRVSDLERRTVRRTAELLAAELERQGIGVVESLGDPFDPSRPWGELRGDAYHMMGGTRMAAVESDGVVDTDGRVFGMDNLYVAGASVFPTGGMANPTLTLIALAMRLGEHLATREPAR